jgi:sulfur-carrier protein adenylyltransferase/sulfurtransferase
MSSIPDQNKEGSKMKTKEINQIFPEDLAEFSSRHKEKDYVVLDVRLPQEYTQEHIPGAKLMPLYEFEGRLGEVEPDEDLILYCSSGKRSMAAAVLARDSGIISGEIYNLQGGITAFSGKTLPNYPKIHFFYNVQGAEDVLKKAMALEKGAQKFYLTFLSKIDNDDLKKRIKRLADLELAHARVIFNQGKEVFKQDFESVFQSAEDDIVEGGLDASAWLDSMKGVDQPELCSYFLELALEIETMAYDMYRNLAEKDLTDEIRNSFYSLSEQEKSHMRLVARMFRDCS